MRARLKRFAASLAWTAFVVVMVAPPLIQFGADRANARHLETLRRVVPALEAAVRAHEHELAALADTLSALPERVVEDGADE